MTFSDNHRHVDVSCFKLLRKIVYATSCQTSGKTINSIELLKVMDVWLCRPLVNMSVICEFAKNFAACKRNPENAKKIPHNL